MKSTTIKKPSYDEIVKNVIASSKFEGINIKKNDIAKIKAEVAKELKAIHR